MSVSAPHFLLISEAFVRPGTGTSAPGRWRFVLQDAAGETRLEAADEEPEASSERLELLAIVRGLEAIDEPAQVTLVAGSRSVSRGIRYGLAQWRENDWQWERYGKLSPVKNGDLWQRIDRAMSIHSIKCRDAAETSDDLAPPPASSQEADVRIIRHRGRNLRIDRPVRPAAPRAGQRIMGPPGTGGLWGALVRASGLARVFELALRSVRLSPHSR